MSDETDEKFFSPSAVIAPFKANKLPMRSVIDMLERHGFDVHICGEEIELDFRERREIERDYQAVCEVQVVSVERERQNVFMKRYSFARTGS